ncbi:MAG: hypothetical protein AB2689_26885 [Candidatus Thiodiazotropha taylori]
MKDYLITIKYPALLIIINSILWHTPYYVIPGIAGDIIFNAFRMILIAWAGWLLGSSGKSFSVAAFTGVILLFLDHPVITGGLFITQGEYQAFYGVLVSFVMFAVVAALVAVIGWWLNRRYGGKAPNQALKKGPRVPRGPLA